MRQCTTCKGTGKASYSRRTPCPHCEGKGYFPPPNYLQIVMDVTKEVKGGRQFRKSPPPVDRTTVRGARAYYVWRLTRFHGGADVTLPVLAELICHGDPYKDELDNLAAALAKKVFGTDMAAAYRWLGALGYNLPNVPDLPPTAYRNGPVLMENDKPLEEIIELLG